jgi:uncharacterized protein involved in exopolysaccharide biosynthesis
MPAEGWAQTVHANIAIVRHRMLFFLALSLLFLVTAVLIDRAFPPMYSSSAKALVAPYTSRVPTLDAAVTPVQVNELGFMQTQVEVLKSASLFIAVARENRLESSIDDLSTPFDQLAEFAGSISGADTASGPDAARARAARLLAARTKVSVIKDTSVLQISVSTRNAGLSKVLAQRVFDKYVELTATERRERLDASATALRERLAEQASAIDKAVAALRAFDESSGAVRRVTTSETSSSSRPNSAISSSTQTEREDARIAERQQLEWMIGSARTNYQQTTASIENIRVALDTLRTLSLVTLLEGPSAATSPDGIKPWFRYPIYVGAATAFGVFATYVLYLVGSYRRTARSTTVTA